MNMGPPIIDLPAPLMRNDKDETVNIWKTRQVIEKLKAFCMFILTWCSTEIKTRQRIFPWLLYQQQSPLVDLNSFISLLIQFLLCSASFYYVNQLGDKCLKAGGGFWISPGECGAEITYLNTRLICINQSNTGCLKKPEQIWNRSPALQSASMYEVFYWNRNKQKNWEIINFKTQGVVSFTAS